MCISLVVLSDAFMWFALCHVTLIVQSAALHHSFIKDVATLQASKMLLQSYYKNQLLYLCESIVLLFAR